MRRRWLILVFVVALYGLSVCFSGEEAEVDSGSQRLWNSHIRGNPPARILSDWELVEGLMLCQEAGVIDNQLAAFATVALHESTAEEFAINTRQLIIMAQDIKGTGLTERERKKIEKLHDRIRKKYGNRPNAVSYKGSFLKGAIVVGLGKTLEDTSGIEETMKKLRRVHGWTATVEEADDLPFDYYKESIDKDIPVLLRRDGRYTVCVGYVTVDDSPYLIVADLGEVPLEHRAKTYSQEGHEFFQSLPPDHPERQHYEGALEDKEFDVDPTINADEPLLPGVTIERFDRTRYHAIFIHHWEKTAEAWRPEVKRIVGK